MALKFDVLQSDRWYQNSDFTFKYRVWQADKVTPRNVAGYNLSWMLKLRKTDPDANALITKVSPAVIVTGVFNSNPALNTQEVHVPVADTDTVGLKTGPRVIELKRTDPGLETVLSDGVANLLPSAHQS